MSGVKKDSLTTPVLQVAQGYCQMALEVRRRLNICQRSSANLTKALNRKTIDIVNQLVISPAARKDLEGEMRNFKRKKQGRRLGSEG